MLDKSPESSGNKTDQTYIKRQKFIYLAEKRTKNAIKSIRIIAKLGNRNAYQFDESDVKKIVGALNREVEALRSRMLATGGKETVEFKL